MARRKKSTNALLAIDGFAQALDVVHLTVSDIDAQADFRLLIQSQRAKEIALDAVRFAIVLHDDVRNANGGLRDLYLGIRQR